MLLVLPLFILGACGGTNTDDDTADDDAGDDTETHTVQLKGATS